MAVLDNTIDSFGDEVTGHAESEQTGCEAPEPGKILAILSGHLRRSLDGMLN